MKKRYLVILAFAAVPPAIAVAAQGHHLAGAGCLASYNSGSLITRGPNMLNWDTNGVNVACPIDFTSTSSAPVTVNPVGGRVDYWDFHGSQSVRCQLSIVTNNNTVVSSAYHYSCGTLGGCLTDTSPGFTGGGYLDLTDDIASTANTVGMSVNCVVPGYDPNWGTSGLMGVAASI